MFNPIPKFTFISFGSVDRIGEEGQPDGGYLDASDSSGRLWPSEGALSLSGWERVFSFSRLSNFGPRNR